MKVSTTKYLIKGDIFSSCSNLFFFYKFPLDKMHYGKEKNETEAPSASCFSIFWSFRSCMLLRFWFPWECCLVKLVAKQMPKIDFWVTILKKS